MKLYLTFICSCLLLTFNTLITQDLNYNTLEEIPTTIMEFETTEFDFGEITAGEKVIHTFIFKNTGDTPLIISNAKGSCGCTVPFWPKEPIAPGESGEIEVQFDSKGKKGKQSKRVTITANTNPIHTYLTIKGAINKPVEEPVAYNSNNYIVKSVIETPLIPSNPIFQSNEEFKPVDCFAIYPNPTAEILNLDFKDHIGQVATINIYNQTGKLILYKKIDEITESVITFQVDQYPAGTYYANIQLDNHAPSTKCFIVSK